MTLALRHLGLPKVTTLDIITVKLRIEFFSVQKQSVQFPKLLNQKKNSDSVQYSTNLNLVVGILM